VAQLARNRGECVIFCGGIAADAPAASGEAPLQKNRAGFPTSAIYFENILKFI